MERSHATAGVRPPKAPRTQHLSGRASDGPRIWVHFRDHVAVYVYLTYTRVCVGPLLRKSPEALLHPLECSVGCSGDSRIARRDLAENSGTDIGGYSPAESAKYSTAVQDCVQLSYKGLPVGNERRWTSGLSDRMRSDPACPGPSSPSHRYV